MPYHAIITITDETLIYNTTWSQHPSEHPCNGQTLSPAKKGLGTLTSGLIHEHCPGPYRHARPY
jgi:hypothetical protein